MFDLPISVTIEDREYPIRNKGDYRMVLDCFDALNDNQLSQENRLVTALIIFYDNVSDTDDLFRLFDDNTIKQAVLEMMSFFNCGQSEVGARQQHKLIDWKQDEQLIASAVNDVAGKELRLEPYIHWWTFMGYFMAVGECTLSTIVGIRDKIKSNKKLEKYEQEFKRDNPHYFVWDSLTPDELDANELLLSIWNKES